MRISLKVIYLMTASVSLLSVTGNKGGPDNINCNKPPVIQKARHGDSATINCQYPRTEENNIKHFCREDGNFTCKNLISTDISNLTILGRFSLIDDKQQRVYTVIISTLTQDDGGSYRCVMERADSSTACLTKIHLHILSWDDITSNAINRGTGELAQINCIYPDSHESNEKFLCKGENPSNCEELIHTSDQERDFSKGRFKIRDNRRRKYFYVYIDNLSTDDSGSYWCGSSRMWVQAYFTKIVLSVAETHKTRDSLQEDYTEYPTTSDWIAPVVAASVCLVLILIVVIVVVLCRHNLPWTQVCSAAGGSLQQRMNTAEHTTQENHGDHHFDEIQMSNQQANSGEALQSVYATVNLPADQLHYASVNFQKDSVGVSTDRNALPETNKISSNSMSMGGTHPSAAEQTLYSTVTKSREP